MRILIVQDDCTSRKFLLRYLSEFGDCDLVADGRGAIELLSIALKQKCSFDLICMDIPRPENTLSAIRKLEAGSNTPRDKRVKVIMTGSLNDAAVKYGCFNTGPESYSVKPFDTEKFRDVMVQLGLGEVVSLQPAITA